MAQSKRKPYVVRQQTSGRTGVTKFIVVNNPGGRRVSVEPCATREIAQAEADDLNACAPSPPTQHSIVDHAKQIVIDHGPAIALELTEEVVQQSTKDLSDEEKAHLMAEVQHQAERTYRFLGYEPPSGWLAHLN